MMRHDDTTYRKAVLLSTPVMTGALGKGGGRGHISLGGKIPMPYAGSPTSQILIQTRVSGPLGAGRSSLCAFSSIFYAELMN